MFFCTLGEAFDFFHTLGKCGNLHTFFNTSLNVNLCQLHSSFHASVGTRRWQLRGCSGSRVLTSMLAAPLYNVPTTTNNPNTLLPHIRTQCSYLVEKEKWNRMNTSRIYLQLHFLVWKRLWFPRPSWLLLQYNTSISCFQNENVSSLGQSVPPHLVCRDIFRRKVWSMEAPGNTIISCKPPRRQICYKKSPGHVTHGEKCDISSTILAPTL